MRDQVFTRNGFDGGARDKLRHGRWCNADVWRVEAGGAPWVVKDFRKCAAPLRWTWGVWIVRRELRVLRKLNGLPGIPAGAFRMDRFALGERFIEGSPLRALTAGRVPVSFFERLEAIVREMHGRGIAHLDLRNAGNILMDASGTPMLLDFQSAVDTRWLPGLLRKRLEWIDLSGIYKHWMRLAPGTMGETRERVLLWQLRNRGWWRIRGYRFSLGQRELKIHERELLAKYGESD
jgi:hypothetical protein